ncbi:hypothetical protein RQP46_010993 [Phenoliferia psychrophenolica]
MHFPAEIVLKIAEYSSYDPGVVRNDVLYKLSLVSVIFNACSNYLLYGDLRIDWSYETASRLWWTLTSSPRRHALAGLVRRVNAYFIQKLDLIADALSEITQNHIQLQPIWFARLAASDAARMALLHAPGPASATLRRAFIEEETYKAADDLLWRSPDSRWVQRADGPVRGTAAFLTVVAMFPNLEALKMVQFHDLPPPTFFATHFPRILPNLLSLDCGETSERLLDVLLSHVPSLESLSFDYRNDEEQEEIYQASYTSPFPLPRRRPSYDVPRLANLDTLRITRHFTPSASTRLTTSPITTLHLTSIAMYDFITLHSSSSFPSVLSLHLDAGETKRAQLPTLSSDLGNLFPFLEHIALEGWEETLSGVTKFPAALVSLELRLLPVPCRPTDDGKSPAPEQARTIEDVIILVREVLKRMRGSPGFSFFTVVNEGLNLRGTVAECDAWERGVHEALRGGFKVLLQE